MDFDTCISVRLISTWGFHSSYLVQINVSVKGGIIKTLVYIVYKGEVPRPFSSVTTHKKGYRESKVEVDV